MPKMWIVRRIIFLYFVTTLISTSCIGNVDQKPEIFLSAYQNGDSLRGKSANKRFRSDNYFEDVYASKNNSDYIVFEDTYGIAFTCEAYYPIHWVLPYPEQITERVSVQDRHTIQFEAKATNTTFTLYQTIISADLWKQQFFSVNFTCSSIDLHQSRNTSSVYVYYQSTVLLENQDKTVPVLIDKSKVKQVLLPCRPAIPSLSITLEQFKQSNSSTLWTIPLNKFTFDPKFGIQMEIKPDLASRYRCHTNYGNTTGMLYFSIEQYSNVQPSIFAKFQPMSSIQGNASVYTETFYLSNHSPQIRIICCSGVANSKPALIVRRCPNPVHCQIQQKFLLESINEYQEENGFVPEHLKISGRSDCTASFLFGTSHLVACKGINIIFMHHYVKLLHPLATGSVVNRTAKIEDPKLLPKDVESKHETLLSYYKNSILAKESSTNQTILLTVGWKEFSYGTYRAGCGSGTTYRLNYFDLKNVAINAENLISLEPSSQEIRRPKWIQFVEYNRDVHYVGEQMVFMCLSIEYFYALGGFMKLLFKNGTTRLLDLEPINDPRYLHWTFLSGSGNVFVNGNGSPTSVFSKIVIAVADMAEVQCYMPRRTGIEWDMAPKKLAVLPGAEPVFREELNETVYFYTGDESSYFSCTVIRGSPLPKITVKQGDVVLNVNWTRTETSEVINSLDIRSNETVHIGSVDPSSHQGTVWVFFPRLSPEWKGQYYFSCEASNLNGKTVRHIFVIVNEKSSVLMVATGACIIFVFVIFLGLGISSRFSIRKAYVKK